MSYSGVVLIGSASIWWLQCYSLMETGLNSSWPTYLRLSCFLDFFPQVSRLNWSVWPRPSYSKLFLFFFLNLPMGRTLWILLERSNCRQESDCQVEEARIWKSLLSSLHPNQRYQLWHQLHMPGPKGQAGGSELWKAPFSYSGWLMLSMYDGDVNL